MLVEPINYPFALSIELRTEQVGATYLFRPAFLHDEIDVNYIVDMSDDLDTPFLWWTSALGWCWPLTGGNPC